MQLSYDWKQREPRPYRNLKNPLAREYFERYARRVYRDRKNAFILFLGEPGSGKSLTAVYHNLVLCQWFGPDTFSERIIYLPSEFFDALGQIKHIGDVLMWDEFGVGLPKREWWKASSLAVNKIFQIFRGAGHARQYKGRIFFSLVAPDKDYIDSQAFRLCNAYSVCFSSGNTYGFKPYFLKHDRFTGKTYRPRFRAVHGNVQAIVDSFLTPVFSKSFVDAYEARSRPSKNKLIREFIEYGLMDDMSKREHERELVAEFVDEIVTRPDVRSEVTGVSGKVSPALVHHHFLGRGVTKFLATNVTKKARARLEKQKS